MTDITDQIAVKDGEYRLRDPDGEHGVYSAIPFFVEGQLIPYPADEVDNAISGNGWKKMIGARAGPNEQICGIVMLNDATYHTLGILEFFDPDKTVAMVCDKDVLRQVMSSMLYSTHWNVTHIHGWFGDTLYEMVDSMLD